MSFAIHLPTNGALQRSRFSLVRKGLTGKTAQFTPVELAEGVVVQVAPVQSEATLRRLVLPSIVLPPVVSKIKAVSRSVLDKLAIATILLSVVVGLVLVIPQLYYLFTPVDTVPVAATAEGSALGGSFEEGAGTVKEENPYLPEKDENLPEGEWLVIPRIGVRTQLRETADAEEALAQGVWKVPGYGDAGSLEAPVILAAHRFGWEWWWQSDYWKYNSFYLLPDTEPGDIIEIISDQRKWTYEIYGGAEGDAIADYDADLILYTCKFLNSPVRHFRYARLINPNIDTQG